MAEEVETKRKHRRKKRENKAERLFLREVEAGKTLDENEALFKTTTRGNVILLKSKRIPYTLFEGKASISFSKMHKCYVITFDTHIRSTRHSFHYVQSYEDAISIAINYSKFKLHGVRLAEPQTPAEIIRWNKIGRPKYEGFIVFLRKIYSLGYFELSMEAAVMHDYATVHKVMHRKHPPLNFYQLGRAFQNVLNSEEIGLLFLLKVVFPKSHRLQFVEDGLKLRQLDALKNILLRKSDNLYFRSLSQPDATMEPETMADPDYDILDRRSIFAFQRRITDLGNLAGMLLDQRRVKDAASIASVLLEFSSYILGKGLFNTYNTMVDCALAGYHRIGKNEEAIRFLRSKITELAFSFKALNEDEEAKALHLGMYKDPYYNIYAKSDLKGVQRTARRMVRMNLIRNLVRCLAEEKMFEEAEHPLYAQYKSHPDAETMKLIGCIIAVKGLVGKADEVRKLKVFQDAENFFKGAHALNPHDHTVIELLALAHVQVMLRIGPSPEQVQSQSQSMLTQTPLKSSQSTQPWLSFTDDEESDDEDEDEIFDELWNQNSSQAREQMKGIEDFLYKSEKDPSRVENRILTIQGKPTYSLIELYLKTHSYSNLACRSLERVVQMQLDMTDEIENANYDMIAANLTHLKSMQCIQDPFNETLLEQHMADVSSTSLADTLCGCVEHLQFNQCPSVQNLLKVYAPWSSDEELETFVRDERERRSGTQSLDISVDDTDSLPVDFFRSVCVNLDRIDENPYSLARNIWAKMDRLSSQALIEQAQKRQWWKERFFQVEKDLHQDTLAGLKLMKPRTSLLVSMISVGIKMNLLDVVGGGECGRSDGDSAEDFNDVMREDDPWLNHYRREPSSGLAISNSDFSPSSTGVGAQKAGLKERMISESHPVKVQNTLHEGKSSMKSGSSDSSMSLSFLMDRGKVPRLPPQNKTRHEASGWNSDGVTETSSGSSILGMLAGLSQKKNQPAVEAKGKVTSTSVQSGDVNSESSGRKKKRKYKSKLLDEKSDVGTDEEQEKKRRKTVKEKKKKKRRKHRKEKKDHKDKKERKEKKRRERA